MIGAPLALLGLLAVAVPVLIHLLGRHHSRVLKFPTLRFIPASRLAPTRRRRISDWPLLIVRCAIVATGALALSQPYFACAGRVPSDGPSVVSRAIVLDTSFSMRNALDSARRTAGSAGATATSTLIQTDDLRHGVRGALAWLHEQRGSRELMVISDFQAAAMDVAELAAVDSAIGISLVPIESPGPVSLPPASPPVILAGPADSAGLRVLQRAGLIAGTPSEATDLLVIYESAPGRAGLIARAEPITDRRMGGTVTALRRDATLRAAARAASAREVVALDTVAVDGRGRPVVSAGQVGDTLLLFVQDDAGSLTSAGLMRALALIMDPPMRRMELDTARTAPGALARWNRPASPGEADPESESDGRWLWALALLLIVAETVMRRRAVGPSPSALPTPAGIEDRAA